MGLLYQGEWTRKRKALGHFKGMYRVIGIISGLHRDNENGKWNGNYYLIGLSLGFRVCGI